MMKHKIDTNELKKIEFELLCEFHNICEAQGFRYSLGGGTLLGAVRHQGFIPWDDDIDVMMPRPDYDKFLSYCKNNEVPFRTKSFETDNRYVDMSSKICNPNTILEENDILEEDEKFGVYIDIFPIDGLGKTYKEAKKQFQATSFKRNLLIAAQWRKFQKSKTHSWYYEPIRFVFYLLAKFINKSKTFEKIQKRYMDIDFDTVNFVGAVGGSYREKEILPQQVFIEYTDFLFEGESFKVISAYDTYLSSIYGDYMTLPPEEKRVSHHTFTAYYKEVDGQ